MTSFYSGLPESEIKELLGNTTYDKALIAFNKDQISKAIQSQLTGSNKSESEEKKRKARKRTKEDIILQCNEKVVQLSCKDEVSTNLSKRDHKIKSKFERSPSFGKENILSPGFDTQKLKNLNGKKVHISNIESPFHQKVKTSILDS
jgi:hypothetical protein